MPAIEAAAADRDQHRVDRRQAEAGEVLFPFQPDRALAGDRRRGRVGVDRQRAAFRDIGVAQRLRVGVGGALTTTSAP